MCGLAGNDLLTRITSTWPCEMQVFGDDGSDTFMTRALSVPPPPSRESRFPSRAMKVSLPSSPNTWSFAGPPLR